MAQRAPVVSMGDTHQITAVTSKKKLVRKTERDYSQGLRHAFQLIFLLLNVWLGGTFFLWVRQYETGNAAKLGEASGG